ncbi:hypothetical protein PIB30_019624 [Stylosanthes scabra]|uniref:Ribonuclease H1 N-terminal domain-containing protein n=1 Tax=Stylosanthes scabra TaxID=79078 RepID=A0ABU6R8R4_9FABA|nr:hypothetical protein [Stylosanthes scabra]
MAKGRYSHYAVRVGKVTRVFTSWEGAQYKGFHSLEDALAYMQIGKPGKGKVLATQPCSAYQDGSVLIGTSAGGGFVIVEDMEFYLLRTCHKLEAGCPIFERKVFFDMYGQKLYAFSAALRCKENGINMATESCFWLKESKSREEVSFKLLDSLLKQTGKEGCDFNYRRNYMATMPNEALMVREDAAIGQRLREVERHCEMLKKVIKNCHKQLGR